jgi:hypothetical protein
MEEQAIRIRVLDLLLALRRGILCDETIFGLTLWVMPFLRL